MGDYEGLKEVKLRAKGSERRYNRSLKPICENKGKYLSYLKGDLCDERRAVFVAMEGDKAVGMITGTRTCRSWSSCRWPAPCRLPLA